MLCDFKIDYDKMPYILENNGIVIDVNDIFLNLTGFNKEELLNSYIYDIWENLLRVNIELNSIDNETEVILFTKSLDVQFISLHKYKGNKDNEFLYTFSEKIDLRLENKFQFLNRLISDNKSGIAIYTAPDLILIKANEAFINYIPKPYNHKELVYGKSIKEFRSDFSGSGMERILLNVIQNNKSYYFKERIGYMRGYEDRYWDNEIIPIHEEGKVKYVVSILDDVTERVLSRKHMQVKNKQLEAIFNCTDDFIEIFDNNGTSVMGKSLLKVIGKETTATKFYDYPKYVKFYELSGMKSYVCDLTPYKVLNGEIINGRKVKIEVDGDVKIFSVSGRPIFNENGEVIYGVIVMHDITEEIEKIEIIKKQNKELKKALVMKDEFISLISHEFKTPLNVIYSAIQLIQHVYSNQISERVENFIVNIKQNTFRLLRLVNNLLDITKINSGQFKLKMKNIDIVFLTKAIMESVKLYAQKKSIKLSFYCRLSSKIDPLFRIKLTH